MTDKKETTLTVGTEFGPFAYTITEEMADMYIEAIDNQDPLYKKPGTNGRRVVPSCFSLQNYVYLLAQQSAWGLGGVHTAQESEYFNPLHVGDRVVSRGKIVDRYQKKGRNYFVMDYIVEIGQGTPLAKHRITGISF